MSRLRNTSIYDIESQNEVQDKKIVPIALPIVEQRGQEKSTTRQLLLQVASQIQEIERLRETTKEKEKEKESEDVFEICGKLLILLLFIILVFPIIICDMYYAYNDDSCVNEYPKNLNMNMKQYLLGCAYSSIITMAMICIILCIASKENIEIFKNCGCLSYIMKMFTLIWHILGAIIFWGTLYPEKLCTNSPSSYFFASLIIKLLSCAISSFSSFS
jgi:hypothetical protein